MKTDLSVLSNELGDLLTRVERLAALAKQDADARVPKDEERARRELAVAKSVAYRLERALDYLTKAASQVEIAHRDIHRDVAKEMKEAGVA